MKLVADTGYELDIGLGFVHVGLKLASDDRFVPPVLMSQQKISPSLKYALWAAYDFKCFYHREYVRWDALCIDHLIPEYLADKPEALADVLASVGREPDCILLDQARGKVAEVERLQQKYETKVRTGAQLAVALSNGRISEAEVGGILAGAAAGEDLVRLTSGLEIFDGVPVDQLRPSAVEELLDKPVKLGTDLPEGLPLVNHEGASIKVRTAREYRAARDTGYYGNTTFDMKMEAFFITASKVIEALAACRPSSQSFIRTPRVGVCDIHLLPSSVLVTLEADDEERDRLVVEFPTVADLVRADEAQIAWVDSMFISIDFLGIRTSLQGAFDLACRELSIWRPRLLEMDDLLPLAQISSLRNLALREMKRVTSLHCLTNANLRFLELEDMRALHSYTSFGGLTGLDTLIVRGEFSAEHIEELACLDRLKSLYLYGHFVESARRAAQAKGFGFAIEAITAEMPTFEIA